MVELIPLALVGLLCGYWWRQGTRLRLAREAREAEEARTREAASAEERCVSGGAATPPAGQD